MAKNTSTCRHGGSPRLRPADILPVREAVAKTEETRVLARREIELSSVTKTLLLVCVASLLAIGQLLLKAGVRTASVESSKAALPDLALSLAVTWQFLGRNHGLWSPWCRFGRGS